MSFPPLVEPVAALSEAEAARTARHRVLAGFGDEAQRRLAGAHVAVIGAGGIGSPVILALAAAGVGTLTVVDDDVVEVSNLQRQILHRVADAGARKVDSAVRVARDLSPETRVRPIAQRLDAGNAETLLRGADLVVDGSDSFATRTAVAAACEQLGVPLVWGVVQEFHAQATVFWSRPSDGRPAVLLRDLYPPELAGEPPSCSDVGVLGVLCLQLGALLAAQAVALLTGAGEPLFGRVAVLDARSGRTEEIPLNPARTTATAAGTGPSAIPHLTPAEARAAHAAGATYLDVREPDETAQGVIPGARLAPLAEVLADPAGFGPGPLVVVCHRGPRAERAAAALLAHGARASVLAGGMSAWDGTEEKP